MILENNIYITVISKSIMAVRRHKKIASRVFLHFWMAINPKLNYQDSQLYLFFLIIWKNITDLKTRGIRELFLPENDFKTCSTVNFQKKPQILEAWKPTKYIQFRLEFFYHMPFYIWAQYNIKIVIGT